jgi:1-phosphofructokinase/tagatose 6-phosphate kinase
VLSDFVRIREESRTNTAVIDPTTGEQTEINERGPKVSAQEVELFVDKLLYLAKGASMCVFAGSLPARRRLRHLRRPDPASCAGSA